MSRHGLYLTRVAYVCVLTTPFLVHDTDKVTDLLFASSAVTVCVAVKGIFFMARTFRVTIDVDVIRELNGVFFNRVIC